MADLSRSALDSGSTFQSVKKEDAHRPLFFLHLRTESNMPIKKGMVSAGEAGGAGRKRKIKGEVSMGIMLFDRWKNGTLDREG